MAGERSDAGEMLAATLDGMARGGIYDQLGGGFHRYATDREWKIPHFEKMLYDNGFLLENYAREHARTGDPQAARIARQTAAFLAREMTSAEGSLWSAIDAETDGDEGAFYVWKSRELTAVLGEDDAAFAAPLLGFAGPAIFEGDRHVLHVPEPWDELARRRRRETTDLLTEVDALRARLLAARGARPRPATDDKVQADWNGIAIAGLAVAGRLLGEPGFIAQAARAADFVLREMRPAGGPLLHVRRQGPARVPAFLADYAFLVRGLLALHEATAEPRWLAAAAELASEQQERLGDANGGFFVAGAAADLLFRSMDPFDGATPAPNAVAVINLIDLAERQPHEAARWRGRAEAALRAFGSLIEQHPEAVRMLAVAARRFHGGAPASAAAAHEREAGAGPLAMLEEESAHLVTLRLDVDPAGGGTGGWRRFRLHLDVAAGWHLQANPASAAYLLATALGGEGAELRDVAYPAGETVHAAFAKEPLAVYQGQVEISGACRPQDPSSAPHAGGAGEPRLVLAYQLCDHARCLPPVRRFLTL
jgi:uncharacterized protein YyaL (SSP411 family)